MPEIIEKVKELMTAVAIGKKRIESCNDEYIELYQRLDDHYRSNGLSNPNPHEDLWAFYTYWKECLPHYSDRRVYIMKLYRETGNSLLFKNNTTHFVDLNRIKELEAIDSPDFDLSKLIEFCKEINLSINSECYLAVPLLGRGIIDHVPPIFGVATFNEVASQHGNQSFKESMDHLGKSLRKIADSYLHTQIRRKESLPNRTQIDFSNDLDCLLAEICRVLK